MGSYVEYGSEKSIRLVPDGDGTWRPEAAADQPSALRELTHVVATVSSSGDTTVHTPASGKAIRLWWAYAVADPTSETPPLIKVKLGSDEKYRAYALSKSQRTTGDVDAALVVNLSGAASVACTFLLEEVDP